MQPRRSYVETFDHGPGGWYGDRHFALPVWDGVAYCCSPWWLDANHAPPGAGYLHLLMWLYTDKRSYQGQSESLKHLPYIGNRFADDDYSRDLTSARVTLLLRGKVDLKGAQLLVLVQAKTPRTTANMVLTGQPFEITSDWSEQTVTLTPEARQWTCLGARHDMQKEYGCDDIAAVLRDVNLDLIFALFPVRPVAACDNVKPSDVDRLRAVADYPVRQEHLPKGLVMFDTVKIDYPQ
jgi:hypothetical protein